MSSDAKELQEIAAAARRILEVLRQSTNNVAFKNFPHGCCGDTSELLGRYFVELMGKNAQYVTAERHDDHSHAWLVVDGFIIDITADQFGQDPIIVAEESVWHDGWDQEPPRQPLCSQELWGAYPSSVWNALVEGLACPP